MQDHGILSRKHYNDGRKRALTWISNDTEVNQQQLFRDATYNFTEITKKIYVRYIQADKNGKTNKVIDLENGSKSVKEQRHRGFGRCYTYHPEQSIRDLGVYYTKFYL